MKKQRPFHYEAKLVEVDAEIAVEFYPDCDMINIYFIKDGKEQILTMINQDLERSGVCEIDNETNELKFYDLVFKEKLGPCEIGKEFIDEEGEELHEEN